MVVPSLTKVCNGRGEVMQRWCVTELPITGVQKLKNYSQILPTMLVSFICDVLDAPTVFFSQSHYWPIL